MMKRGLSTLNTDRTPAAIFEARQTRLRHTTQEKGLDAAIIYGDVSTGGDIAFLTHSTLYWGNAILVVPAEGPTVLVMTLSPRTQDWFRATSVLDEMISGPQIASLVHQLCIDRGYTRLGLVDQDYWPAEMAKTISGEGTLRVSNLGPVVRDLRTVPDEETFADLTECAELGALGLDAATTAAKSGDAAFVRAEAEFAMRAAGAWDATTVVTVASGGELVIQLRCQIRDAWYGAERVVVGSNDGIVTGQSLFDEMIDVPRPGISAAELRQIVQSRADARLHSSILIDVVLETAPDIEQQHVLVDTSKSGFPEGSVLHAALWGWADDGSPVMAFGDTFRLTLTGAISMVP